jgi:cell division protein FtsW
VRARQVERQARKQPDFAVFFTVLILAGFGLIMVFSASYITSLESRGDEYFFLRRQAFWVFLGLGMMILAANLNYWKWRRLLPLLTGLNFLLLLAVFVPGLGVEVNEAKRWIMLGGFTLQPAELSKMVVVLFSAAFLSKKNLNMENFWQSSFIPLVFMGLSFIMISLQPDLGTAIAIAAVAGLIIFVAGIPFKQMFSLVIAALPVVTYLALSAPYRMKRIFSFLDPWADPLDKGYHIIQSLFALGPGTQKPKGFREHHRNVSGHLFGRFHLTFSPLFRNQCQTFFQQPVHRKDLTYHYILPTFPYSKSQPGWKHR